MENNLGRYQAFPESLGTSIELKSGSREASWGAQRNFFSNPLVDQNSVPKLLGTDYVFQVAPTISRSGQYGSTSWFAQYPSSATVNLVTNLKNL